MERPYACTTVPAGAGAVGGPGDDLHHDGRVGRGHAVEAEPEPDQVDAELGGRDHGQDGLRHTGRERDGRTDLGGISSFH
jgi:hypothetical protein